MATPTPEQVYKALLNGNDDLFLLDNLVSTGEAAFNLIHSTELDGDMKYVFFELEKRFQFYATLVLQLYGTQPDQRLRHAG
ncbi:MAG: hypothetical protein NTW29_22725 [Bacteroidetes bacterium]|nr:hypothetical protein [Bacteroidota bacterium]